MASLEAMVDAYGEAPARGLDALPRINYYRTHPGQNGFFYAQTGPDDQWTGWTRSTRYAHESACEATRIALAIIGFRLSPFRVEHDRTNKPQRVYVPQYEKDQNMRFLTQVLCFLYAKPTPVLVMWHAKGMVGQAITSTDSHNPGIVKTLMQGLVDPAGRSIGKTIPLHTFFVPVGTRQHHNAPMWITTDSGGGSSVPALAFDATHDTLTLTQQIERYKVDPATYRWGNELVREHADWFKRTMYDDHTTAQAAV